MHGKKKLDEKGIDPLASRMLSERSTTELKSYLKYCFHRLKVWRYTAELEGLSLFATKSQQLQIITNHDTNNNIRVRQDSNLRRRCLVDFESTPVTAWVRPHMI